MSVLFLSLSLCFFVLSLSLSLDDHSRVILQPIEDDPSSDYINANYIDVSGNASNATIGSQRNQRNHTPSLVCQASIPLSRLPVIHFITLYIQPSLNHTIQTSLFAMGQALYLSLKPPLIHLSIHSEFVKSSVRLSSMYPFSNTAH